ncbi:MAG TPA: lipopolysaccharide kinase InaA family protein [Thermoanaerobaculia bacterium]|nr:lipopolysaccharide kinase InaA family protein [Thermoanaerobaculia bacterium]
MCRADLQSDLRAIYQQRTWVYDSLSRHPDAIFLRGRRSVVAGPIGESRFVVKRMSHGGLLAPLFRDFFFTSSRARAHIHHSEYLSAHGVRTAPVAFASWRRVLGLLQCEVGFTFIEGGLDADAFFFGGSVAPAGWEAQAAAIGALVARLHQIGFLHGDLNLMNFLIDGRGELYILDLDKTVIRERNLSGAERSRNLARLERSIRKQGRNRSARFVNEIIVTLRATYDQSLLVTPSQRFAQPHLPDQGARRMTVITAVRSSE